MLRGAGALILIKNNMRKTEYLAGKYYIKMKGRGLKSVVLTKNQAKVLFQLKGELEITGIGYGEGDNIAFNLN